MISSENFSLMHKNLTPLLFIKLWWFTEMELFALCWISQPLLFIANLIFFHFSCSSVSFAQIPLSPLLPSTFSHVSSFPCPHSLIILSIFLFFSFPAFSSPPFQPSNPPSPHPPQAIPLSAPVLCRPASQALFQDNVLWVKCLVSMYLYRRKMA